MSKLIITAISGLLITLSIQTLQADSTWVYTVQISVTVQTSPPQITLNWEPDQYGANSYTVYRKSKDATSWGGGTTLSGSASSFVDNNVSAGSTYEYQIIKAASQGYTGYGYIYAGINAPLVDTRGSVVLVVDNTYASQLATELSRLQSDLAGDGWTVVRRDVARTDSPASVRSAIQSVYNADPGNVKAVFLFGHVPILRSGNLNVDGHQARPMPADPYYGDMNGGWDNPSFLPSDVELMVGRVDLFNLPGNGAPAPWPSELEMLRNYLNKDHNWRHKLINVPRRALLGNRFGDFGGEAFAASGFRNFQPMVGPGNIVLANEQDSAPDNQKWSSMLAAGTYLWAYGCGGGSYTSMSGMGTHGTYHDIWSTDIVGGDAKAVFFMMFGSWLGEWDSTDNIMRSVLATSTMGLTCSWAGRPHWYYHHMGLGEPIGYSARLSQNNGGLYQNQVNQNLRGIHIALMGDPTLRLHPVAPPSAVRTSTSSGTVNLTWTASPDSVAGYHVYRAATAAGPFTRLTSSVVNGTSFSDTSAPSGASIYMVRAVKLESCPSGTYFNSSQGAYANASSSGGNNTPTVTMTAPGGGATVSGSSVTVSANVLNISSVAGVQFKLDGSNLGAEDTSAPYSVSWNTTQSTNGAHRLRAVARDSGGGQTTSAEITVTVNNSGVVNTNPVTTNGLYWVDDALPAGAVPGADGGDAWTWVTSNPAPFSGTAASQSSIGAGAHQHFFNYATATLTVNPGDVLFAYVYLDPSNLPSEIMLQWTNGSWEHRAYWGANNLPYGTNGTPGRFFVGPLPSAGQWVRLQVPASQVGLEGSTLKGMAFTLFDGRATWDAAGKSSGTPPSDTTPPIVAITAPANNAAISGTSVTVSANASDNAGVAGVQFKVDGANLGAEDTTASYGATLNTTSLTNGTHRLTAVARDAAGNRATSAVVTVLVSNLTSPPPATNTDMVWFDDSLPANAIPGADGGDSWNWVTSNPTPFSGAAAHQSNLNSNNHQHYFNYASATLAVNTGDVLFAYVYLDPANPPQEVMLQWNNDSWEHRAYWGANINSFGADGTVSRHSMGLLPALGKWVRLEVPARSVGLEGSTLKGMAFSLSGGRATWDRTGKRRVASVISLKTVSTGMAVSWPSEPGQSYRVMCTTNISAANWTEISGPITATNETTIWMDTSTGADPQRFYQIVQ